MTANSRHSPAGGDTTVYRDEPASSETSLIVCKAIKDLGDAVIEIEMNGEAAAARIGFGCLVKPISGDRVLAIRTREGVFILSVLERLMPYKATLTLPSGGALVVEASDIRLAARKEASIDAPSVDIRSGRLNIVSDTMTLLGRMAHWVAEHMAFSAQTQETVVDTLSVKALDRVAIVERADVLQAQSVSQTIENVAVTSAPTAVIATTEDLRLDGKRVTVG